MNTIKNANTDGYGSQDKTQQSQENLSSQQAQLNQYKAENQASTSETATHTSAADRAEARDVAGLYLDNNDSDFNDSGSALAREQILATEAYSREQESSSKSMGHRTYDRTSTANKKQSVYQKTEPDTRYTELKGTHWGNGTSTDKKTD